MIRSHEIVQQALLGALAAALFTSIVWLIIGETPSWWVTMLAVEAMALAGAVALKAQRKRRIAQLQADFERPAFGENRP